MNGQEREMQEVGNRDAKHDPLVLYLSEIRHELLTPDEELALGRRAQAGDEKAIEQLIRMNLRLVVSFARPYAGLMPLPDLIQEGNIGLMEAAKRFDPDYGVRFSTFAIPCIRNRIFAALNDNEMVALPEQLRKDIRLLAKFQRQFLTQHGHEPTAEESAGALQIPLERVQAALRPSFRSMDQECGEDADLHHILPDDAVPEPGQVLEVRQLVSRALALFSSDLVAPKFRSRAQKMRTLLEMAYGVNGASAMTSAEIAQTLGIAVGEVNDLLRQALAWLQRNSHHIVSH